MRIPGRLPLFVQIGLMWWLVLLSWPPSRPLVVYDPPLIGLGILRDTADETAVRATLLLGALSLLHALGAAWLIVRVLPWFHAGRSLGSAAWWTLMVAWFAAASGCFVIQIGLQVAPALAAGQVLGALRGLGVALFWSTTALPFFAFTIALKTTWILLPLAAATVWAVRAWAPRRVEVDGFGRPLAPPS